MKDIYYNMSADRLAEYVLERHGNLLDLVKQTEGDLTALRLAARPQSEIVEEVRLLFQHTALKIRRHLRKEGTAVLPFAKRYARALKSGKIQKPGLLSSCGPVQKMYQEHKEEVIPFALMLHLLRRVDTATAQHPVFCQIMLNLIKLKLCWQQLVTLENDVLFPKIIEMESILYPM